MAPKNVCISVGIKGIVLALVLLSSLVLSVRFGSVDVPTADIFLEVGTMISQGQMGNTPSAMILWYRTVFVGPSSADDYPQ